MLGVIQEYNFPGGTTHTPSDTHFCPKSFRFFFFNLVSHLKKKKKRIEKEI